jgi:hypothetical protein
LKDIRRKYRRIKMAAELVKFITYRKNGLTFGKVIEGEHKDKKCFFFAVVQKRRTKKSRGRMHNRKMG